MKEIIPLGKNVLVKIDEVEKVTESGIILPGKGDIERPQQGEVVSAGESEDIHPEIKKGVRVVFEKYEGPEIEIEKEKFLIIKSKNILGIIK